MFEKQTGKNFLKTLSKATLILLLPVSVGMTMPLAAAAQKHSVRHASGWEKIVFEESKDIKDLVKTYPFLKPVIQDMQDTDKATSGSTQVLVSDMRSSKEKLNLLFIRLQGSNWCGSAGCALNVYADDGKGYKKTLDAVVNEPVYLSKGSSKVSLLFCTDKGLSEWNLKNHAFVYQSPFTSKNAPSCP